MTYYDSYFELYLDGNAIKIREMIAAQNVTNSRYSLSKTIIIMAINEKSRSMLTFTTTS